MRAGCRTAQRQAALEVAANQYAIAQRHAGDTSDSIRYRLAAGNGETLMLLGRYEEATNALQGVIELVGDDEHKARIDLLQGDIAFKQGAIDRSVSFFQQGLRGWITGSPVEVQGLPMELSEKP